MVLPWPMTCEIVVKPRINARLLRLKHNPIQQSRLHGMLYSTAVCLSFYRCRRQTKLNI